MRSRTAAFGTFVALFSALLLVVAAGIATAANSGPEYGTGTVTAVLDPALGELAEAPPGYPTTPTPVRLRMRCSSPRSCTVTAFTLTEGRTNPLYPEIGPLPLQGTKTFPQPPDDECPVETTLTSNLKLAGKQKVRGRRYPASVSGTVVFSWPVGEYEPTIPCGGETWTYTFTKARPTGD